MSIPAFVVIFPLMYFMLPFPKPGSPPESMNPANIPGFAFKFFLIWLVMMASFIVAYTFALRWLLKTKWSDFRLVAIANEPAVKQND